MGMIAPKLGYAEVTQAAPTAISTGPSGLYGITVTASTGGTITIYDNTSAAGTILFTKTGLSVGETIHFGGLGIAAKNGLYVSPGGTCTVIVLYT